MVARRRCCDVYRNGLAKPTLSTRLQDVGVRNGHMGSWIRAIPQFGLCLMGFTKYGNGTCVLVWMPLKG